MALTQNDIVTAIQHPDDCRCEVCFKYLQDVMRRLGSRTSERKKASSRANAKRPRKAKKQTVSTTDAKSVNSDFSREKITTNNP